MSDEASFLAAIAARSDEDTPRLAFADWLDEHDRPDEAELIRVQCELEPIRGNHGEPRHDELWDRERALTWSSQRDEKERLKSLVGDGADEARVIFRRGLIEALGLPVQWVIDHGGTLREWYPTLQRFVVFRVNGWGERLAACPHLSGLPELELPCWYSHADCAALAASEHLADLEILTYWRAADERSTDQLCTFAGSGALRNLRKLRVMLADSEIDERLVNTTAGRPIAEVIDPRACPFPFAANFKGNRFFVGRIADGRQFFALDTGDDERTTRAAFFDAAGNEVEQRDIEFPLETLAPVDPKDRRPLEEVYRERRVRHLHDAFGFEPAFIRVNRFRIADFGPDRLPYWIDEAAGRTDDPSLLPELDRGGALGTGREVYDWITRGQFVFWCGNDWWCDETGHVTAT